MTVREYEELIFFLKKEHNLNGWNALDLKAADLMKMAGDRSLLACVEGMKANMLEGDRFLKGNAQSVSEDTEVRFYCDNLRPDRRRIFG